MLKLSHVDPSCSADIDVNVLAGFKINSRDWFKAFFPKNAERGAAIALMGQHRLVAADRGTQAVQMEWGLFRVPVADAAALRGLMQREANMHVRVALVDAANQPIKQTLVPLDQACHFKRQPLRQGHSDNKIDIAGTRAEVFFVSPLLWWASASGHAFLVAPQPCQTELTVTAQEAKRIAKVVLFVEQAGGR
jgi:hypothetical protein